MTIAGTSFLVSLAMFFLVLGAAPRDRDNQLMAAYMTTVAFWGVGSFLTRFMPLIDSSPVISFNMIALGIGFNSLALAALITHYARLWNRHVLSIALVAGLVYFVIASALVFQGRLFENVSVPNGQLRYDFLPLGLVSFVVAYVYYGIALWMLWAYRQKRPGNLLVGGIIIAVGVLTTLTPTLSQFGIAMLCGAISCIIFARALLTENLFEPLAVVNEKFAQGNEMLESLAKELRQTNKQLVEASRLKSTFLANMSHELRTPLNSIIGYTEMLTGGIYGPLNDKQSDRLDRVKRNGRQLLQLINDILDLSKIEANRLELELVPVNLTPLIQECLAIFEPLASSEGLTLSTEIAEPLPSVLGDQARILQVIMNLVSNAVKFTPEGNVTIRARPLHEGEVHLATEEMSGEGPWMLFEVADTGIGIASEHQSLIFEEFRQVDESPSRTYEGTGLGLTITRQLVRLMDGTISVQSASREGSTFSVLLPISQETALSAEPQGSASGGGSRT